MKHMLGIHIVLDIMLEVLNKRWYWQQYTYNVFFEKISYGENKCFKWSEKSLLTEILYIESMQDVRQNISWIVSII